MLRIWDVLYRSYKFVRKKPMNPSELSAANLLIRPNTAMNLSEYGYESVRIYLLICPGIPVNLSEQSYINVRKHRYTLLIFR